MGAPELHDWSDFFTAEVGAAAALAGLLMVSISINLARILEIPELPGRAGETLALLVGALAVASLALVPGQPEWLLGVETLVVGVAISLVALRYAARSWPSTKAEHRKQRIHLPTAYMLIASLPLAIGGILLIAGNLAGLYGVMAGVILAMVVGVLNAWVLLVEIMR